MFTDEQVHAVEFLQAREAKPSDSASAALRTARRNAELSPILAPGENSGKKKSQAEALPYHNSIGRVLVKVPIR